MVAALILNIILDKIKASQIQQKPVANKLDAEKSTLEVWVTSKTNSQYQSNNGESFDELISAERIPYPRTSGARFCPNGLILGVCGIIPSSTPSDFLKLN